ncbi:MAG: hypothetical protein O2907_02965 [Proteobacteria bacterium]|nr:hypothetical protein [Pseudomonadota bacterium]MDA1063294.1 hypothetical protein [Pseudomonadota bacterium]
MSIRYAANHSGVLSDTQQLARDTGSLLSRKVWLPKLLYVALPWFYLAAGIGALAATIYIGHWVWVLPHYALFSVACLHMGILIYRRRRAASQQTE